MPVIMNSGDESYVNQRIITLSVAEAQFLLLVGEVSSNRSYRRHNYCTQDAW